MFDLSVTMSDPQWGFTDSLWKLELLGASPEPVLSHQSRTKHLSATGVSARLACSN